MNNAKQTNGEGLSIVIPSYNEGKSLSSTINQFKEALADIDCAVEIIIVNDGSSDGTIEEFSKVVTPMVQAGVMDVKLVTNPKNKGYGFSLKRGIRLARYNDICICDADGTYPISQLSELYGRYKNNYLDMVICARTGPFLNSGILKAIMRKIFISIAEFTTGQDIPDINSGYRIFKKDEASQYLDILSSGFSFTTSITILFFQNNLFVDYMPMPYYKRHGKTKVKHFRDALRALQIISHCILVSNPLKLFFITIICYVTLALLGLIILFFVKFLFLWYMITLTSVFIMFSMSHLAVQNLLLGKLNKKRGHGKEAQ